MGRDDEHIDSTNLPEVAYSDLPEVASHDFPEVKLDEGAGLEVVRAANESQEQSFRRRYGQWISLGVLLMIGAILGGVIGGTKAAKSAKAARLGTNTNMPPTLLPNGTTVIQKGYVFPTAVSSAPGRLEVAGVTDRSTFWHKPLEDYRWLNWSRLYRDAPPQSSVALVGRSVDLVDFFLVGSDGSAYWKWWRGRAVGWTRNGTKATLDPLFGTHSSSIEAISLVESRIDLFSLNQAKKLQWLTLNNNTWGVNWRQVGGDGDPKTFLYTPTVISWTQGRGDLFVVEETRLEVFHSTWIQDLNFPTVFDNTGGYCTSRPSAVSWAAERMALFCRGVDFRLWWTNYTSPYWSAWEVVGGSPEIVNEPHAVSSRQGRLDVYVQTAHNSYATAGYNISGDSINIWAWRDIGGSFMGPPKAVVTNSTPQRIHVFGYSPSRSLMTRYMNTSDEEYHPVEWQDVGYYN